MSRGSAQTMEILSKSSVTILKNHNCNHFYFKLVEKAVPPISHSSAKKKKNEHTKYTKILWKNYFVFPCYHTTWQYVAPTINNWNAQAKGKITQVFRSVKTKFTKTNKHFTVIKKKKKCSQSIMINTEVTVVSRRQYSISLLCKAKLKQIAN